MRWEMKLSLDPDRRLCVKGYVCAFHRRRIVNSIGRTSADQEQDYSYQSKNLKRPEHVDEGE
jgi:hypothetical protein